MDSLQTLTEDQCIELLWTKSVGRIVFASGAQPEVFPVNYATDGKIVIFRICDGTRLEHATESRVAFEVDDWDPAAGVGWSVVIKGVAEEVTSGTDPFEATLRTRPVWPVAPGRHDRWIAVYPAEVTGRRFGPRAD